MKSVLTSSSVVHGELLSARWPLQAPLQLVVDILPGGLVRLRIREINNATLPSLFPRFEVPDVLLNDHHTNFNRLSQGEASALQVDWAIGDLGLIGKYTTQQLDFDQNDETASSPIIHHHELHIQARPFVVTTLIDGQIQIQGNARALLMFEQYRARNPQPTPPPPPPLNDDAAVTDTTPTPVAASDSTSSPQVYPYDEEGMWSESWAGHTDTKPRGPSSISLDFTFTGRHVYGLPEHASSFALKSTRGAASSDYNEPYRLFNLDVFEYELNEPMALYGAVPILFSHTLGGTTALFWLNSAETFVDITDTNDVDGRPLKETHWISESGIIDVFLLPGPTPYHVFSQYAAITGTPMLPQRFAVGYHQCRWNYRSEEDVADVDGGFDTHDIPYDVLWLDIEHTDGKKYFTWDRTQFPTPKAMQDKLAVKGRKMVSIVDPHIKRDSNYRVHNDASSAGHYVKKVGGGDYEGWCWPGSVSYLDFMEPSIRDFWAGQFLLNNYEGSTSNLYIWNDMNEPSVFNGPEVTMPKDCLHGFGSIEHRDVHNMYGFYVQMATYEGLLRRSNLQDRPFVLTRSFFAGSQRYGAVWTGDNHASWGQLAAVSPMLLSLAVGGITFSGADVGGFFGDPDAELLVRWYQSGAYQPFFRGHAHIDTKRREPWLMGEPFTTHIRSAIRERYALLPYIYSSFATASRTGIPVLRPLWTEFVTDTNTHHIDATFMLGDAILVAPVTAAAERTLLVYLPTHATQAQRWYDGRSFTQYNGGQTVHVSAPLDFIPVFYRAGTIIPRRNRPRRSSSLMENDPFTLLILLDQRARARGELYLDDGHSFDYQRGAYQRCVFRFADMTLTSSLVVNRTATDMLPPYDTPVTIERIVVVGLPTKFNQAVITDETGSSTDLLFIHDTNAATLRKPNVKITSNWSLKLIS